MRKICASFALIVKRKLTFSLKLRSFSRTARTELDLFLFARIQTGKIEKKSLMFLVSLLLLWPRWEVYECYEKEE